MSANVETMFSVRETPLAWPWPYRDGCPCKPRSLRAGRSGLAGWRAAISIPALVLWFPVIVLMSAHWWCRAWCRVRPLPHCAERGKHSVSRMICWVKALPMKPLALCKAAKGLDAGEAAWEIHYRRWWSDPISCVFNSHDGSSGVKVAMTPVRVVCQNTLNLALSSAKRIWPPRHTENVLLRVQDARETLQLCQRLYGRTGQRHPWADHHQTVRPQSAGVHQWVLPYHRRFDRWPAGRTTCVCRRDLKARYYNAPDLEWVGKNGWRFVNAVSGFCHPRRPYP